MEKSERIQISSDQFFSKLFIILTVFIIGLILYYDTRPVANPDFKDITEYKIIFFMLILILAYLFTRPAVYYDSENLYIKKFRKAEVIVSLKNIKSVYINISSSPKGGRFYTIEYPAEHEESGSIKFYVSNFSESMPKFITDIKKLNPNVGMTDTS